MNNFLPMITERDGIPVTTSRVVAEQFSKRHDHVLRDIEELVNLLKNEAVTEETNAPKIGVVTAAFAEDNFILTQYTDAKGEARPMYLLTRDGFTLLAMGFTGARAVQFKVAYINAFNRMERLIRGGGLSSGTLQRIEERLGCLEEMTAGGRSEAGNSVGDLFLQAIREALASGDYCLREKFRKHTQPSTGTLIGIVDGSRTTLMRKAAYEIYAAAVPHPVKPIVLWAVLEEAGAILPRKEHCETAVIDGKQKYIVMVHTDDIKSR